MKKSAPITSIRVSARYQENLLEKYVNKYMPGLAGEQGSTIRNASGSADYKKLDCCFVRIPVTGNLEIDFSSGFFGLSKSVKVPVSSHFIVTCVRDLSGKYKSSWACSLS